MEDKRAKQLAYELESDAAEQAKQLQELIKGSNNGATELPRASALIARIYTEVQQHIEEAAAIKTRGMGGKFKAWIRAIPSDVAAVLGVRECIRILSGHTHVAVVQDLASSIGKLLELEVRIRQAEAVNPLYMRKIREQLKDNCTTNLGHIRRLYNTAIERVFKGEVEFNLTKSETIHIGKFVVDACLKAGLIESNRITTSHGMGIEFSLNPEIETFLTSYTEKDVKHLISKEESRMLCPPDDWTNLSDGGYMSLRRKVAAPLMNFKSIRRTVREEVVAEFTAEKMPSVFAAGNYMQSIAYDVHPATRDAITRVWKAGGGIMGVPTSSGPVRPDMPLGPDWIKEDATEQELVIFTRWKRSVVAYWRALREWRGKVREISSFMRTAKADGEPIWFPMYFDKRCRWYYRGLPNPQGSDLSKAVLHFHEKKPLGSSGLYWLRVHIANSAGFDKDRFDDRARWTEQNWGVIERALDEPENFPEVWGTDAPWCMYSAAWELREALRSGNPEKYVTGIPVHMDATCSGLQHFSAILRDPVGARYVNLIDEAGCGPKQDIYSRVASVALQMIQADTADSDEEVRKMAEWWLKVGLPRSLAKHPVMTYVYGATIKGTAEHLEELLLRDVLPATGMQWEDGDDTMAYCRYAAKKLFAGIAATVPAAAAAMQWLKGIARQQPNGRRMQWRTPTEFLVQHDYQEYEDVRILLNSCNVVKVTAREYLEGTRAHAMQNAIAPNFVHAMDASHLTIVANQCATERISIVAIHDSFGTHPSDVQRMHGIIREGFVQLYSNPNLLGEFMWEVGAVGEPPQRGDFDLQNVLNSEFFFC